MRERNPAECASVVAGDRGDYAHIPVTSLACPVGDRGFDGGVRYEQEVGETDHEVIVRDTQPPTAEKGRAEWVAGEVAAILSDQRDVRIGGL